MTKKLTVVQMLPELESGGVERGTLEMGKYLVEHGHRSIVIASGGRMVDKLKEEGSEHIDWPVGKKSLSTIRYIKKVRAFLKSEKPDILHLRSRLPAWIGYLAWKKLPLGNRPKLVTTVHGPYTVGKYSSVMVRGERVISVSDMIQDYILKNYSFVNPNAINVVHRGVDTEKYTPEFTPDPSWYEGWCDQYPDLENKKILTLPARLTRWKGQLDFIEIIELLVKRGERVHGLIVGSAHSKKQDYENELRNAIHSRRLEDDITMIGHRNDLKEILSISNIVFSLSTEPEAFGRTTIEALSLGTPVIGYNHGGVKEQLQSILPQGAIPVGDIGKVTDMAQSWLQSPTAPMENTRFTLELMCEKTFKIYKELTINESANS